MQKVYVIGSINMDLVINSDRFPEQGETVGGNGFFTNPGGKGANQAVASAKAGAKTYFCGCIGDDSFGETLLQGLKSYGVDCEFVQERKNCTSGIAVITVVCSDNRIILNSGANGTVDVAFVNKSLYNAEAGDILLVQQEIDMLSVLAALKIAKNKGMVTILNPAPAKNKADEELLKLCDYIVPNETEAQIMTGQKDFGIAVQKLGKYGSKVIITLGSQGCLYYDGKSAYRMECTQVNAVDTTAAGDTLCGSLAACLSLGETPENALKYALYAASLAVTKKGAQQSVPDKQDVLNFIEQYKKS